MSRYFWKGDHENAVNVDISDCRLMVTKQSMFCLGSSYELYLTIIFMFVVHLCSRWGGQIMCSSQLCKDLQEGIRRRSFLHQLKNKRIFKTLNSKICKTNQ